MYDSYLIVTYKCCAITSFLVQMTMVGAELNQTGSTSHASICVQQGGEGVVYSVRHLDEPRRLSHKQEL